MKLSEYVQKHFYYFPSEHPFLIKILGVDGDEEAPEETFEQRWQKCSRKWFIDDDHVH